MHHSNAIPTRDELLELEDDSLLRYCHQETYRASGPGGQHRNTTDSAVRLTVLDGVIVALCTDHRSQHRNRSEALKRLRLTLAIELRMPIIHSPSEPAQSVWQGFWKLGQKDRRYAGFIAHILDVMAHQDWAVGHSAKALGISTGKLVRTLAKNAHAWNAVNLARAEHDLVNLRRP